MTLECHLNRCHRCHDIEYKCIIVLIKKKLKEKNPENLYLYIKLSAFIHIKEQNLDPKSVIWDWKPVQVSSIKYQEMESYLIILLLAIIAALVSVADDQWDPNFPSCPGCQIG